MFTLIFPYREPLMMMKYGLHALLQIFSLDTYLDQNMDQSSKIISHHYFPENSHCYRVYEINKLFLYKPNGYTIG